MSYIDEWSREYEQQRLDAEARVASGELSQRDCDLCGEPLNHEIGEMHGAPAPRGVPPYDPIDYGIVHAQCGLDAGWEVA